VYKPGVAQTMSDGRQRARRRAAEPAASGVEQALASAPLFSACSKRELRLVAKLARTRRVPPGTALLVEGEAGDEMFVLLSGAATVSRGGRRLASLGSGDIVGELGVLSRSPRNATATTTTEAELAVIGRRAFNRLLADAPGFARKLLEALAERVRELDRHAVS
jgi:CRP/FNR family transcriptional regulator, cyclic AMP receptor protein